MVQGFFKVCRDESRDSGVMPVYASNKEIFIRVAFYFSEDGFTNIFMRDREFINRDRMID